MISSKEFGDRREALRKAVDAVPIFIAANDAVQDDRDSSRFRQEANFFYLTGIDEPGWVVAIDATESVLFAPSVSDTHALFDGSVSWGDIRRTSGIAIILPMSQFDDFVAQMAVSHSKVTTLLDDPQKDYYDFALNQAPLRLQQCLGDKFETVVDCRRNLARLRAIKSPAEISLIEQAIAITTTSFEAIKQSLPAITYEYEIDAQLSYDFRHSGSAGHAYAPIVAAGGNACTLHYGENNSEIKEGDFVLVDAGTQVEGYAADITRTFARGAVSDRQRAIHEAVQRAHAAIIALIAPGVSFKDYHAQVDEIMKQALASVKLLRSKDDYRRYFPHAVSHGLGLNVHDSLGGYDAFEPGMVLTVEPGIYIPEESIGVRIEDDVLVTSDGHRNLSSHVSIGL